MKKIVIAFLVVFSSVSFAKTRLKVGVLAPEGTNWAKNLKKMAKETGRSKSDIREDMLDDGILNHNTGEEVNE